MRFLTILTQAVDAFAAVTGLEARAPADNIGTLLPELRLLDQYTVNSANNGFAAYTPNNPASTAAVFGDLAQQLGQYVKVTFIILANPGLYSQSSAQQYINFLSTNLVPNSEDERDKAIVAGPRFKKGGLLPVVIAGLTIANVIVDNFAKAIESKTPANQIAAVTALVSRIQRAAEVIEASYIKLAASNLWTKIPQALPMVRSVHLNI